MIVYALPKVFRHVNTWKETVLTTHIWYFNYLKAKCVLQVNDESAIVYVHTLLLRFILALVKLYSVTIFPG